MTAEQKDTSWGEGKQQHEKTTDYRQLTEREIDDMNRIKAVGQDIEAVFEELATNKDYDQRWLVIAKRELQRGLVAATRAVARPAPFCR